ncbi:MAG TPA: TonB-dependent receptor [Reyranella sp.]|nr:TonB-dependent receptor [Reyranella sp.]
MSIRRAVPAAVLSLIPVAAVAQDQPQTLPPVTVVAPAPASQVPPQSPFVDRFALPQTIESTDQKKIEQTINIIDPEDAFKYLPSLLIRKRNYGDTQPTVATRMWGINSSARSLVYVDDLPISALISNNNTNGAPRWGLVSPEQIKGVDMLYGPFAAEYPGNSMGGVLLITTRQPEKFEATLKQTEAVQSFGMYSTYGTYTTSNSAVTVGDKVGKLSFFLSINREESFSQPLVFITNTTMPAGTSGGFTAVNKQGTSADVVGAGGLLHTIMNNYTAKIGVDLTDWLRASYTISYWQNNQLSTAQSYLTATNGTPTFGGVSGFASNTYNWTEQHLTNALSLKTDTKGNWDGELVVTRYDYLTDIQRSPAGVLAGTGTNFTTNGLFARLDGSGWQTEDAKAIWRPDGPQGAHEVSFGGHHDKYVLNNPTYTAANWQASPDYGTGLTSTYGMGKTETWALWLQDAWKITSDVKATLGLRGETWTAYGGFVQSGSVSGAQPQLTSTNLSPKASVGWQINPEWTTKFSFGEATRYPTVSELYQIVSTGATFAIPNPNLLPETALDFEWYVQREDKTSRVRFSLFEEDTQNALIQQTQIINGTATNTWQNVGLIRNRGFELVGELKDVLFKGLSLANSVTWVDSRIISDPGFQSATGTIATGQRVPYVPEWRDTAQVIYSPTDTWSLAASMRFQSKMYSTLDNSDVVAGVQGAFDPFFIVDLKARYRFMDALTAEFGVDNVANYQYFLFHPFPGRTFVASLKARF